MEDEIESWKACKTILSLVPHGKQQLPKQGVKKTTSGFVFKSLDLSLRAVSSVS